MSNAPVHSDPRHGARPHRRWFRLAAAVSGMTLALTACGGGGGSGSGSGSSSSASAKIGLVPGGPNVYFTPWQAAATAAQKDFGIHQVSFVVPPTPTFEPTVEINTLNSLVSEGYNGLAVFPDGATALAPEYQRITSRNIPVIDLAGCTQQPTPALFCLATDVEASAYQETEVLIKAMGGHGNIAFLTGLLTDANTILREDGVKKAVDSSGGKVKLIQVVSNIDTPSAAPPAIESLLASKGDQIQGMLSTDYYPSVAAAGILTKNPQYRHIIFIGQDNDPSVMNAIASHAIYGTMYQNSYGQGYLAAYMLNKMVTGHCKVNPKAPFKSTPQTNHFIDSGYFFVGQNDVQQYLNKPENIPASTKKIMGQMSSYLTCPSK